MAIKQCFGFREEWDMEYGMQDYVVAGKKGVRFSQLESWRNSVFLALWILPTENSDEKNTEIINMGGLKLMILFRVVNNGS